MALQTFCKKKYIEINEEYNNYAILYRFQSVYIRAIVQQNISFTAKQLIF